MFETSLVASRPQSAPTRSRKLLPAAALVHAGLLGGILLAGSWSVDALPEPDLAGKSPFVSFVPPPVDGGV